MKIDPGCCRLCFIYDEDPIDIFGDASTESRITDLLAQYFMDQVTQDDGLPKVVCHDCWNQIDMFHSFVQRIITVREDYLRQSLNDSAKEGEGEEVTCESVPSMDEMNIHEEDVCVEPVSMCSGEPMTGEIELMDTKFQINMETEENEAVFDTHVECDEIGSDADQIDDQNTINTKPMAHIDTHTVSKSSRDPLDSPSGENEYICDICNERFGSKFLMSKHLRAHFEKPQKPTCHICFEQFKSERILERHSRYAHVESSNGVQTNAETRAQPATNVEVQINAEKSAQPALTTRKRKLPTAECPVCKKIMTKKSLIRHKKQHDDSSRQTFTCDICGVIRTRKETLLDHQRRIHLEPSTMGRPRKKQRAPPRKRSPF